eukprot:gene10474-19259_t
MSSKLLVDQSKLDIGEDVDIFRQTSLRYLGYANELGESFRPVVN